MSLILMQDLHLPSVLGTEMVNLGRLIQGDVNLTSLYEDRAIGVSDCGLAGHPYLSQVTLKDVKSIYATPFIGDTNLETLRIQNSTNTIVTLYTSNAFSTTKITPTTGSIYVPSGRANTYKTAPTWSYFSAIIR